MKKVIHFIGYAIIVGNLLLIGMVAWWLLHPYTLPAIKEPIPIMNENKIVAVGEPIKMKLQINKPREMAPTSINRTISCNDGNLVTMTALAQDMPTGSYTTHSENFILPPKVAKGSTCKFNFQNTYKLNPLRSETVIWSSEDFRVAP